MKPVAFQYTRPANLACAIETLCAEPGVKPVAGGQSLGPMLNLRLARPGALLDVSRLPELLSIGETAQSVTLGACVTHAAIEDGKTPEPMGGFIRHVAGGIAYRVIRNKGTLGGSLAHADPAADWLTALTAAGATLTIARRRAVNEAPTSIFDRFRRKPGERPSAVAFRKIDIRGFVAGAYTTALEADELLTCVEIPKASSSVRWGYDKFCRKVGELADAIGAVVIDPERGYARVVAGSIGGAPLLLEKAARRVATTASAPTLADILDEVGSLAPRIEAVKRQHVAVCLERAIHEALWP
jgi:carbon-monoxide dehydrogenase medium subunit